jgi:hypothetical protein
MIITEPNEFVAEVHDRMPKRQNGCGGAEAGRNELFSKMGGRFPNGSTARRPIATIRP